MTRFSIGRFLHRSSIMLLATGCVAIAAAQSASEFVGEADAAYFKKEYAKGAELYSKAYRLDTTLRTALYNAACCFALAGRKEEALSALEELAAKGYNDQDLIKTDTDLEILRSDPRWAKIVANVEANYKTNPKTPRWKKPFEILVELPTVDAIEKRLAKDADAVWLDGDILTFVRRSKATEVRLTGGIQEAMTQLPGTEIWIIRLKMEGWDKAFASYGFVEGTEFPRAFKNWRGDNAPAPLVRANPLKGEVFERKIHSKALNEERKVFVYLPPNAPKTNLPAVFLADGGACADFAAVLEPLILSGKVRPCAIVGMPSGTYAGDPKLPYDGTKDFRAKEYLPNFDRARFDSHLKFFTDEVGAYVAKEFGISTRREDLAVTGFSNGGAFAAAVAFRRPEFFGVSMPLSLGISPEDPKPSTPMPDMYFAGGTLESFGASTSKLYEKVKGWGMKTSMDLYVAGHDSTMWQMAFANLMQKAFPPK